MKKQILLFLFIMISLSAYSQFGKNPIINLENMDEKTIQWGYYLGFNTYDFRFDYKENVARDIKVDPTTGFNVGLIGDLRLNSFFNLRFEPGLSSNTRFMYYPEISNPVQSKREIQSTYIYMPLLLKISTLRTGNIRPFITTGLSTAINLSSNHDSSEDNSNGKFRMVRMPSFYELGFGIDLYLEYFKFTPSIRGIFGIQDELIRDQNPDSPWTGNIEKMTSRGIFINFTFQ